MAVQDLWVGRDGQPTKRHGRGLRYRVVIKGWPTSSHRIKREAEWVNSQRITAGPPTPSSSMTVGEGLDKWLERKDADLASLSSIRRAITAVRPRWQDVLVVDVTAPDVQDWVDAMTSIDRTAAVKGRPLTTHPASASTRRKRLQALRGALAEGVRAGAIPADPTVDEIRVAELRYREPRYLTLAELQALAQAASQPETIWLMGTTGVRSGEASALDVGDVVTRRSGKRLRVRMSKNGEARDVPVPGPVLDMLDLSRPATAPLLTSPQGRRLHMRNWRRRVFDPAVEACNLDGLTPHDLRHTAVSLAIAQGADVKVVQRIAGHKTAAMTMDIYGHLMDDSLDAVGELVGKAILTLGVPPPPD